MTNLIGVLLVVVFAVMAISQLKSAGAESNDEFGAPAEFQSTPGQKRKAAAFYLFMLAAVIIYFASSYVIPLFFP
jgi:hypothetical protein